MRCSRINIFRAAGVGGLVSRATGWLRVRKGANHHRKLAAVAPPSNKSGPQHAVVAIDGPAASGKGSLARSLANAANLAHLDTGSLYRAVALKALTQHIDLTDEAALVSVATSLTATDLSGGTDGPDALRREDVGSAASKVSVFPAVRSAVGEYARRFAWEPPEGLQGVVLDGRDVGTVLCPQAQLKIFLTASPEVRAQRRLIELQNRGDVGAEYDRILQDIMVRDERDSKRAAAPLHPAESAHLLDNSSMGETEVLRLAVRLLKEACPWVQVAKLT